MVDTSGIWVEWWGMMPWLAPGTNQALDKRSRGRQDKREKWAGLQNLSVQNKSTQTILDTDSLALDSSCPTLSQAGSPRHGIPVPTCLSPPFLFYRGLCTIGFQKLHLRTVHDWILSAKILPLTLGESKLLALQHFPQLLWQPCPGPAPDQEIFVMSHTLLSDILSVSQIDKPGLEAA